MAGATGLALLAAGVGLEPAPPPRPPAATVAPEPSAPAGDTLPRSAPVRVTIPAIHVSADVVPVAGDADGRLEVPPLDRPEVTGWYRPGVSPGEAGNAVIVGHVDSLSGPAVFFNLGRLRVGDTIRVDRVDSTTVAFRVDGVGSYPKERFPTERVYGGGAASRLRLVTCGGRFDVRRGDYLDNVVVFATRVP
ncbi:Sortase family protein [Micromonospora mirobrigensis]|uniref:Sortase family protein n=1 Tax=Micromonospora mirobrigensis TaxID=262898 RepID=A0A1C4W718_9ACTN|nr:class F sortase [Micromonospora mirobrigensis]SCE92000.1 Sortase family protein [Micromonospora mirobrigensis]